MSTLTESIGSNCFSLNSLPSPAQVTAEFFYAKYNKDESTVDANNDNKYVKVLFNFESTSFDVEDSPENIETLSIHNTSDLTANKFSNVSIKDSGFLSRMYQSFERSCRIRSIKGNATDKSLKLSKFLEDELSSVDANLLQDVSSNYSAQELTFFNQNQVVQSDKFSNISGIYVNALLSDTVSYDVLRQSEISFPERSQVSLGLLSDNQILERQNNERSKGNKIDKFEMETVFDPIEVNPFTSLDSIAYASGRDETQTDTKLVAFQIEKTEIFSNGTNETTISFVDARARSFDDELIRYGSKYSYSVKAIYKVGILVAQPFDSEIPQSIKVLIASEKSNVAVTRTVEKVPPPYPVDVNFRFDYQRSEMSVRWEFPVNRSQDVTRFQVFRRQSSNEPFLLLKEIDFDESALKIQRPDEPLPVNVRKINVPIRSYIDKDFGRSSTYIYAICCVDAHGYVSNYSAQYEVSFDTRERRLRVRCVSSGGAPRPYPNLYFNTRQPLVADTITRGKVSSLNFVFDPEYLVVNDRDGNSLSLIRYTGESAKYYMNVIDTNRAEQISVPIEISNEKT
jgi:hypothetical protein